MTFIAADNIEWTDTMWQVWHIVTAKAGAEVWTDTELARACGARDTSQDHPDFAFKDDLSNEDIRDAISALYLAGCLITAFPNAGWRRA